MQGAQYSSNAYRVCVMISSLAVSPQ